MRGFGPAIRRIRKRRGISAAEAGRRLGITRQGWYAIESERPLTETTLVKALEALDSNLYELADEIHGDTMLSPLADRVLEALKRRRAILGRVDLDEV